MSAEPAVAAPVQPLDRLRAELLRRVASRQRFAGLVGTATPAGLRLTVPVACPGRIDLLDAELPVGAAAYPSLTPDVPPAFWYERALHDLFGVVPAGHPRLHPLVLPLLDEALRPRPGSGTYPEAVVPSEAALPRLVGGAGVFTIPHGPVRSGVFESVEYVVETPGEDIPHVSVRPFAKHRGVQARFEGMGAVEGVLLAERVEGIASVAHALAYAHAVEAIAGITVPSTAALVRVVHAELERVANHLDVALRLADAAGLAVAVARFGWHKERTLRLVGDLCGSRFGRGVVVPGGVRDLPLLSLAETRRRVDDLAGRIAGDVTALMETPSFLDRLRNTGPLDGDLAARHGALGPVGRASGLIEDGRWDRPYDAYPQLKRRTPAARATGDALARLRVRWDEVDEAFDLIRQALDLLDGSDPVPIAVPPSDVDGRAVGWAEAPQGEVLHLVAANDGRLTRCAPRSASFHNLALFSATFSGDILTDFPFDEASFGLSIAGVVL